MERCLPKSYIERNPDIPATFISCPDKFKTLKNRYFEIKKSTGGSGSANNEEVLVNTLPHYKTLDKMFAAKPATEAVYSISNVGGENLLVNTDSGVDLTYSSSEKYSRQSLYNMEKINNEVEFNNN